MAPKSRPTTIERARQWLKGGGVVRDDSDDELGIEDYPWEWIYADQEATARQQSEKQEAGNDKPSRKRKASAISSSGDIVGARMGKFECRLGDTVLLKAESGNEAWVAVICDFFEDEEDDVKMANFMWFSTPREIRNKAKKRTDAIDVRHPPYFYGRKC
jgi:origin recognition complex subunit 1